MHKELVFEPALLVKPRLWNQLEVLSKPCFLKKQPNNFFVLFQTHTKSHRETTFSLTRSLLGLQVFKITNPSELKIRNTTPRHFPTTHRGGVGKKIPAKSSLKFSAKTPLKFPANPPRGPAGGTRGGRRRCPGTAAPGKGGSAGDRGLCRGQEALPEKGVSAGEKGLGVPLTRAAGAASGAALGAGDASPLPPAQTFIAPSPPHTHTHLWPPRPVPPLTASRLPGLAFPGHGAAPAVSRSLRPLGAGGGRGGGGGHGSAVGSEGIPGPSQRPVPVKQPWYIIPAPPRTREIRIPVSASLWQTCTKVPQINCLLPARTCPPAGPGIPGQQAQWELIDTNQATNARLPLGAPEQPLGQVPLELRLRGHKDNGLRKKQ